MSTNLSARPTSDADLDAAKLTGYTPISVGHGLVLMVAEGFEQDSITETLVQKCKAVCDRNEHVHAIEVEVDWLTAAEDASGLADVMCSLGWSESHDHSIDNLRRAILALLPVADLDDLITAAEQ